MIHQRNAEEACTLSCLAHRQKVIPDITGTVEAGQVEEDSQQGSGLALRRCAIVRFDPRVEFDSDFLIGRADDPPLVGETRKDLSEPSQLSRENRRRDGVSPVAVASTSRFRRYIEYDQDRREALFSGQREVPEPPMIVEPERVDDREQAASHAGRNHLIENGKGVGACIEIVLAATDDRPQPVGRDYLFGSKVFIGPGGLPGGGRPYENDERRVRDRFHGSRSSSL